MRKRIEAVSPVVATILMVAMTVVLTALLYIMVLGMTGGDIGGSTRWGSVELLIVDDTTLDARFGKIEPQARPMDLKVIIEYDTNEGTYDFQTNGDGELVFASGIDICDINYTDNADDNYVSSGDFLRVSNVPSGSVVKVIILDASGGMIDTKSIDLPG